MRGKEFAERGECQWSEKENSVFFACLSTLWKKYFFMESWQNWIQRHYCLIPFTRVSKRQIRSRAFSYQAPERDTLLVRLGIKLYLVIHSFLIVIVRAGSGDLNIPAKGLGCTRGVCLLLCLNTPSHSVSIILSPSGHTQLAVTANGRPSLSLVLPQSFFC